MLRHGYGYWLDDDDRHDRTVMRDWLVTEGSYDVTVILARIRWCSSLSANSDVHVRDS